MIRIELTRAILMPWFSTDCKQTAYRACCRARNADHWGQFIFARPEAHIYIGSMVLQESRVINAPGTLEASTYSHKWYEILKGWIFALVWNLLLLLSRGQGDVIVSLCCTKNLCTGSAISLSRRKLQYTSRLVVNDNNCTVILCRIKFYIIIKTG